VDSALVGAGPVLFLFLAKNQQKGDKVFLKREEYSVENLPNCDRKLGFWGRHIYEFSGKESPV
jgi:hypothetical protein